MNNKFKLSLLIAASFIAGCLTSQVHLSVVHAQRQTSDNVVIGREYGSVRGVMGNSLIFEPANGDIYLFDLNGNITAHIYRETHVPPPR
jgi:hypothetical protein